MWSDRYNAIYGLCIAGARRRKSVGKGIIIALEDDNRIKRAWLLLQILTSTVIRFHSNFQKLAMVKVGEIEGNQNRIGYVTC